MSGTSARTELALSGALPTPGISLDGLALWLLVGSVVVLLGVAAVRLSIRSGLPSLLIYLAIGLLLGDGVLGIRYDNALLTEVLGYAALTLILIEGGVTTEWRGIRRSIAPAVSLATVGEIGRASCRERVSNCV